MVIKDIRVKDGGLCSAEFIDMVRPEGGDTSYSKRILPKGSVHMPNGLPLSCDILEEDNVPVTLRDGTVIYTDIYRPADETGKVPAIIAWSPYGKKNLGRPMPNERLSGLHKFEGPDPAFWVAHGYAVLNTDMRGIGGSDGDFYQWGTQQTEDGCDFVEWAGTREWCSGKVSFAGTSYLAVSQWFIASQRPAHLACIAPWEGFSDIYRQSLTAGGIPDYEFEKSIFKRLFRGLRLGEDMGSMCEKNVLYDAYWEDKRAEIEKIEVPAYVVASYTNKVHTRGTLESYRRLGSAEKWLRIHNTHEWHDFYAHQEDLLRFFDHYLKNEDNGWEKTAKVRMCVLNPGGEDIEERCAEEYPYSGNRTGVFYLDAASGTMAAEKPAGEASVTYSSDETDPGASFTLTFGERTETAGNMVLRLDLQTGEANDADLFVMAQKLDSDGNELPVMVSGAPYCRPGEKERFEWGNGRCRASLQNSLSEPKYLTPGVPVSLEVVLCPMGMIFEKGQKLRITVSAVNTAVPEIPGDPPMKPTNHGSFTILTGAGHGSALLMPIL